MQKYISGKRIPKNGKTIQIICEKLQLSPDERQEMEELWKKERLGENIYEQRKAIQEMLEGFSESVSICASGKHSVFHVELDVEKLPRVKPLYTGVEITDMIWGLMNFEMRKGVCEIFIILQPIYDLVDSVLLHLAQFEKVKIHHLICIDRRQGENREFYNIQILKKILPLMCAKAKYDVRFYYANTKISILLRVRYV